MIGYVAGRSRAGALLVAAFVLLLSAGCGTRGTAGSGSMRAFVGALLIDGTGASPLPNSVIIVDGGRIQAVGTVGGVEIPEEAERIDVSGRTIIPGLINSHGHVGDVRGLQSGQY